jgi:hypothetical protein
MILEIVPFRPEHAAAFYALNRAWLDEHRLYESVGFVHKPLPSAVPYESADVYMELDLTGGRG